MAARAILALAVPYFFGSSIGLVASGAEIKEVQSQVVLMVGCALATAFFQFWMRWLHISVSRSFEFSLRCELFEHFSKLDFNFFNRSRTGDIMSRLTADVEAVRMSIGPGCMHLFQTGIMAIGTISVMLFISWKLTIMALIPLALVLFVARSLMPAMHDSSVAVQESLSNLSSGSQESFSGARVVKAFAREEYEAKRFAQTAFAYIHDAVRMALLRARFHVIIEVMAGLVTVGLLYFGGLQVIDGELSFGLFASFFGYFTLLIWPMIAIGWTLSLFERGKVALSRLDEVFLTKPAIVDGPLDHAITQGRWSIRNLSFAYDAGTPILQGVSLEVAAGSSLAIVGPTGCGKTTLLNILVRLIDPPDETVFCSGDDIRQLNLEALRRSISMVPQESFLFSDTLRANLGYANRDCNDEAIDRVVTQAALSDCVDMLSKGLDTVVGERGVTLSGGQKQRVAIARALLEDTPTLILDDALSAVDTSTEEELLSHIDRAMVDRTTILVAHRLSSIRRCDQIVVMKEGRIHERGTHGELIALGGWYAETWRRQLLAKELEER